MNLQDIKVKYSSPKIINKQSRKPINCKMIR